LGIEFDLGCPNKVINNIHTKFKKVKSVLNSSEWFQSKLRWDKYSMPQPCPEPNQTACVLSKLALKPAQSQNLSNIIT
jgi:hypothetical protein